VSSSGAKVAKLRRNIADRREAILVSDPNHNENELHDSALSIVDNRIM